MVRIYLVINILVILLISQISYSQGFREMVVNKDSTIRIDKDTLILNIIDSLNIKDTTILEKKDTMVFNKKDTIIVVIKDSTVFEKVNADLKIFRILNGYRYGIANTVIPITDKSVLPVSVILPLSLTLFSRISNNYYDENSGVLLTLSEIASTGITLGIKQLLKRGRPFETLDSIYENRYNSPTDKYAFPSGHTTIAFSIATTLTLRYSDKPIIIAVSYLYAAIVGYGRIYLGVHYPLDVLGGMLVGSGTAALVYSLRKEIIDAKNKIFREKNRPDSNNKELSVPVILGLSIGADLLNNLIQNTSLKGNVFLTSGQNELTARILF